MILLGIDYGVKKIGLALAEEGLAEPILVIKTDNRAVTRIGQFCQKEKVEKIVIGMPSGKLVSPIRIFGRKLGSETGLKVVYQDETLTSREALDKMREAGKSRRYRKDKEDAAAAAIILQNFIDRHV